MRILTFPNAGRWLVAAALAAPLAVVAQTTPAANANTSTTISTNTSASLPGVALPSAGSVLSGTTRAVGGATNAVGGATNAVGGAARTVCGAAGGAARTAGGAATKAYRAAAPEQRAARMSQKLKQELSLDAATTAKVQAAALTRAQKIDAIQMGTVTNKEKNTALQANA